MSATKKWATNVAAAKTIAVMEDKKKKRMILGLAGCMGTACAILSGVYLFRFVHVTNYKIITDDLIKEAEASSGLDYNPLLPIWQEVDQPYDADCFVLGYFAYVSTQFGLAEGVQDYASDALGDIQEDSSSNSIDTSSATDTSASTDTSTGTDTSGESETASEPSTSGDPQKDAFKTLMELSELQNGYALYSDYDAVYDVFKDFECTSGCEDGSRWSKVFIGNASILLTIMLNMCCVCVGAYKPTMRLIGGVCAICTCLGHLGMIITSLTLRFNEIGSVCALSQMPANIPSTDPAEANDDITFKTDGSLIMALAIVQLLAMFGCCFVGIYPLRIPKVGQEPGVQMATQQSAANAPEPDVSVGETNQLENDSEMSLPVDVKEKKKKRRRKINYDGADLE